MRDIVGLAAPAATSSEELPQDNHDIQPSLGRGVAVLIKTPRANVAGVVEEVHPHALSILVRQPVPEGSAVAVEFGALIQEGRILSCVRKGDRYRVCIVLPEWKARDLRAAERFPITQEVRICRGSSDSQIDAVVVDLSSRGIGLQISTPLEQGEIITVESVSGIAFGTVRHSRRLPDGRFRAGVEVFHIMPKEEAIPEHESRIALF
jgi:PilZ domain-containing protein